MIVYVSGKITGTDDYVERFAAAEENLKKQQNRVLNPARFNENMPEDTTWEGYMRACIKQLMKADAVYMLKGWRNSRGAVLEHMIAEALHMKIIYEQY